jgi:hypothetical protein
MQHFYLLLNIPIYSKMKKLLEETKKVKTCPTENKETKQTDVLKISSSDIKERYSETKQILEQQRQKRKIEKDSDDCSKRSKEDMIAMEMKMNQIVQLVCLSWCLI